MQDIYVVQEIVKQILEENPQARCSDVSLYLAFCQKVNPDACRMEFSTVFQHRRELGLPNFDTVGRTRRKLQADHKELRATEGVTDRRFEKWKEFREYASQ